MGEYKDKHGETRLSAFLEKAKDTVGEVVPELVKAGSKIATGNYGGAIVDISRGLKNAIVREHDPDIVNRLSDLQQEFKQDMDFYLEEMDQISKRWDSDNKQSSWLPKNIRPLTLAFIVVSTMIICVLDSSDFGFKVQNHWVDLWQLILLSVIGAYFGSRGLEKIKGKS